MPPKEGHCLKRFLRWGLGKICKQPAIHHKVHVLFRRWDHLVDMQGTTNHCIIYDEGGVHGY